MPLSEAFTSISPHVPGLTETPSKRASDAPLRINVLTDDYWDVLKFLV